MLRWQNQRLSRCVIPVPPELSEIQTLNPKSPKKSKKDKSKDSIRTPVEDLSPIAHPLAQKKLLKKLHKTIKKGAWDVHSRLCSCNKPELSASKARQVKRGVKEVVKGIRKGDKGYVLCRQG